MGIAVLRYDSRGVGGSTGNVFLSTLTDFATTTAINTLQDKKVRAEINTIVDDSLAPVQNDINKIIGTLPGAPIIPPTLPIPSQSSKKSFEQRS